MKFIRFLLVGGFTAFIQLISLGVALNWLRMDYYFAAGLSYILAVCFHYLANRYYTFRMVGNPNIKELARYLMFVFINFIVTMWVTVFSVEKLHVGPYMGTVFSIMVTVSITFIASRYWIFTTIKGSYE